MTTEVFTRDLAGWSTLRRAFLGATSDRRLSADDDAASIARRRAQQCKAGGLALLLLDTSQRQLDSEEEEVDGRVGGRNCDRAVQRSAAFERLDELPGLLVREPPEGEAQAGRVEGGRAGALPVRIARGLHARPHVLDGAISCPTLVTVGELDLVPPRFARESAARIDGAQLVVMPDAGHQPFQECPQRFNELLVEFWSSHGK